MKHSSTEQIHQLYRRSVSNYLAHTADLLRCRQPPHGAGSLTTLVKEASRSLALRAARPIAANFDARTYNTNKKLQKRKRSEIRRKQKNKLKVSASDVYQSMDPQWEDFICMTCGTFLIPPIDQSTITSSKGPSEDDASVRRGGLPDVLSLMKAQLSAAPLPDNIFLCGMKRGRTRRRRASRAKAKQLYKRALSLERRGSTNNISFDMQREVLLEEKMTEVAHSFNVNDGRALSCLVLECGHCGTRHKRKGLEAIGEEEVAKSAMTAATDKPTRNKVPSDASARKRARAISSVSSQISDNRDFISLSSPWQSSGRQSRVPQSKRKNPDSMLLSGGKKKKKKQQTRSNLQDFLSSLND